MIKLFFHKNPIFGKSQLWILFYFEPHNKVASFKWYAFQIFYNITQELLRKEKKKKRKKKFRQKKQKKKFSKNSPN